MERQRDIPQCQHNQENFRVRGQQADQQSALVDATQSIDVVPSYVGGRQPLPEELQLMAEFQRVLDSANVILPRSFWEANYHESRCSLFWRFLVANDGHVIRAKNQLARDVAWRDEIRLKDLQNMARRDVVGIEDAFFIRHYPCLCLGFEDRSENYSPVVYRRLTHLNTKVLAEKGVTVEKMIKHELWQYEKDCRLLFEHPESFPPRQLKVIIDISGMTWAQCTKDLISILSGFSSFSKVHHPERLQKLYIIGAPKPFSFVWNTIVSRIIPERTRNKIMIMHSIQGDTWLEKWMKMCPSLE